MAQRRGVPRAFRDLTAHALAKKATSRRVAAARDRSDAAVSRVLCPRWFLRFAALTGAHGEPKTCRVRRPFLWAARCRVARAVYPLPSGRTGRGPLRARELRDLARGGVCRAPSLARRAVGSYPTVSPLPEPFRAIGGLFSVALSLARDRPAFAGRFGRVGVTHHPVLPCSDFPQPVKEQAAAVCRAVQSIVRTPNHPGSPLAGPTCGRMRACRMGPVP